ncbi:hypothetical protein EDB89DRAFT_2008573 [Lactarius sanguifluus]|nr:hypothetical protein EDB89DRAFT_2008573 [Lactarius sanguifluus]
MQETATASTAFFYFDFRDDEKRNRRGLLASLLVQFCAQSDDCCDILSRLYSVNGDGLRQPSDRALLDCLKEMLTVGKLGPTYIVVDALDECPIITGTPSAREKVLDLVINLVDLNNPNLRLCVTSRPEAGIWTALLPLASHSVSLHEEVGQMVDINNYISFFVTSDKTMSQWREQDRSLVINKLRQEAAGMFRWVFCQLDKLRRCFPGRIRGALDELPRTLDATYERTLQDIDEEKRGYAHRLLQCIAVASRPLRVDELAEFLAVDFDAGGTPTLVVDWRPENPGNAVLSTCSSLIAVVTVDGSPVVQFSHFSVQEFLMSSRLATGCVSHYYISLEPAHTIVAQACLSVLLQLGNHINKRSIEKYPLAHYAAQHWVDHAKFQNVSSRAEDSMKRLFDRDRPHFAAWVWIHDMDREWRGSIASETPLQPDAPPIYYATLLGLPGIAEWLATARSQDVNKKGGYYGTPLCAAAARGHLEVAQVLVKCDAHVDAAGRNGWSPLLWASEIGCLELSRLMLDLGADINFRDSSSRTPLSLASDKDHQEITTLLLQRGADANIWEQGKGTILIKALQREDLVFARRLLMNYGADVNARNDDGLSLLHLATGHNNLGSVRWLFKHGANFPRNIQWAPFPKGDRRITGAFPGSFYSPFDSFWSPRIIDLAKPVYLPDVEGKTQAASEGPATKRRALIVGISYFYSQPDAWWPLGGPHECVDRFRDLLIGTYGYTPDDITVLKDGPKFPDRLQPTRANMISELKKLVGDAAPGDRFTFFYIGLTGHLRSHSDDENGVIVTCDLERIFDYELNDILTLLPVGCFLLAVFDACHTGTMLDLPHSHCNNIYVPWLSKGERHTPTMPYQDVRNHPIDLPSIANVMAIDNNIRSHTYPQSSLGARLQIDTQVGGTDEWQLNRDSEAYQTHRSALLPVPPTLCESPVPMFECDGWCDYDFHSYPIVLSLSASSDPQRAWEGPRGSLTTVLCKYLETQPRPSYRDLLSHINFALHENSHELYKHIREQRKAVLRNGSDFDGEMVNFQGPLLSSLAKLDLDDIFQL